MELRPIRTKRDYLAALTEIEQLWTAPAKSAEADRLDVLTLLVEQYERQHYPIADPDPIDCLHHVMEVRGMTRKDLEAYLGPRGRVSDIMNRTRPMTLEMIRRLADGLSLPADVLIKPYLLRRKDEDHVAA
ncbi:MAG: transcriptional regulator [Betaproteobacteria bacterium]|nr:transcriptional regulator [Betaproteobacteria bacterium]